MLSTDPIPALTQTSDFDPDLLTGFVFEPIAHWASETPDAWAILWHREQISYSALEATTNRMARALAARGVQRGDRVAFVMHRGADALLLAISILKSGAAYVPLDAETPIARIAQCLEDAAPSLVVVDDLDLQVGGTPVALDALRADAARLSSDTIDPARLGLRGDDLAYIIFTSGSTGRPKGVPITHAALQNFTKGNQLACIRVAQSDRVLQAFSHASDGHHEEVWPTLSAGATLVVAESTDVHSGPDLEALLNNRRVTIVSCAPTLLSMVDGDVPSLRRILFGAEQCPPAMVRRWWSETCEVLNTYGPTEATVGATFDTCLPDHPITIGRPLPNYECYILDENQQVLGDGTEGELAIAGIGVSPGYFGRPELNAERFVPNPAGRPDRCNERMYRTGDLVRRGADGRITWLGRMDAQVKVRGHRIELSEIESHLVSHPSVRTAVVVPRGDALVGLIVLRDGVPVATGELLAHLRDELPGYMLPRSLEQVDRLPVLPSGKIDRRSCADLHGVPLQYERELVPPAGQTEALVLRMWQGIFPDMDLSCTDDFFRDLGGYSLLASRFISDLRRTPAYAAISVLDIYANPTIRSFAAKLDSLQARGSRSEEFAQAPAATYRMATVVQAIGVLMLFGWQGVFWTGPFLAAIYFSNSGRSDLHSLLLAVAFHMAALPLQLVLTIAVKWLVGGRIREGTYPMWGPAFLRWWFVQRLLALAPTGLLTGSPLAAIYLRALGARVGRNVVIESLEFDCPDLISIGDDCCLENSSWLHPAEVRSGRLVMKPVTLGAGCCLGVRAGLAGGSSMAAGASLRDLSCLADGESVPAGEEWAGSPARPTSRPEMPVYDPMARPARSRLAWFALLQLGMICVLALLEMLPFLFMTFTLYSSTEVYSEYLWTPAYAVGTVALCCVQALLVKWLVLGRLKPGDYPMPGTLWLRKWFNERHLESISGFIVPVYDSLLARPWCRALGMKCGPRCEIALPRRMPYDLVTLGEESFLASEVSVGRPIRRNGTLHLEQTVIGNQSFIGNDSVVPQGSVVPDTFLLGVLSVCPPPEALGTDLDQTWLGSPPVHLPGRQKVEDFDLSLTYRPTARLYAHRLLHELARVVLPALGYITVAAITMEMFTVTWNELSLGWAIATVPIHYMVAALAGVLICKASKALLVGRYRPRIAPLWSPFVWRTETYSAVLHDFGVPIFVTPLLGTAILPALMRFLGAHVGRRAFINSTDWTETDLIHVAEDAAINANAPLQAHLFEDRVMKMGPIRVGARSSVGNYTVVLCDSEIQPDAQVGHLSLVMKGETIPAGTSWAGSPAQITTSGE